MVQKVRRGTKTYYICDVCRMAYLEEEWATACEKVCMEQHGCSLEITRHAVELSEEK